MLGCAFAARTLIMREVSPREGCRDDPVAGPAFRPGGPRPARAGSVAVTDRRQPLSDRAPAPNTPPVLRLAVGDRNPLVLSAIRSLCDGRRDLAVTAAATDWGSLGRSLDRDGCDLVLISWRLADLQGPALVAAVRSACPATPIVMFPEERADHILAQSIRLGVRGLCYQDDDPEVLFATLWSVSRGRLSLPFVDLAALDASPLQRLTNRERELLGMLSSGWTNLQIAARTGISENTVKYHLKNLYEKLEVKNRTSAVSLFAEQSGSARDRAPSPE